MIDAILYSRDKFEMSGGGWERHGIMCDGCHSILPNFGIPHDRSSCPWLQSLYCSNCARKAGHSYENCPDRPSRRYTQACYVEQLLPPHLIKEYGITTRTPLPPRDPSPPKRLLEILDDNDTIAAFLSARSWKRKKGEKLRDSLQRYAVTVQKRVLYIPASSKLCDASTEHIEESSPSSDSSDSPCVPSSSSSSHQEEYRPPAPPRRRKA